MKSTKFVYLRTIKKVEERYYKSHVSGVGKDAEMKDVSLGWYATFVEDPVAAYLGLTETGLSAGDKVKLTLEKVEEGVRPADVLPLRKQEVRS